MTLSALVFRWFGLTSSNVAPASGAAAFAVHYEEDDEYAELDEYSDEDEPEGGFDPDSDEDDRYVDNYVRLSQLFASSYEEEAAHRLELDESSVDVTRVRAR